MQKEWIGCYYPDEIPYNQRSKAIMCLLFDKIICHFPFAGTMCGGGMGMSQDLLESDDYRELVNAGILEVREEILLDGIDVAFSPTETEDEFDRYIKQQVTAMAYNATMDIDGIAITDQAAWQLPSSCQQENSMKRLARLQVMALCTSALDITIPAINNLTNEDILRAREELAEQLCIFRAAMAILAPTLRAGIDADSTVNDLFAEARYIVETNIEPAIIALHKRIALEKSRFWRNILIKGGAVLPKFVVSWATGGALNAALESVSSIKDMALNTNEFSSSLISSFKNGGLGYLLDLQEITKSSY